MNAQPQAQQAPAAINQSGIAMGNMGPLTQQTQQPAQAPQGMQGLDPKLVAAMMAQFAKQKEAEMNQRQMALQAPQPQGTVVDQLLAQAHQPQAAGPAGIQQLMQGQRGNVPQAQAQGIDAAPTPQHFKEGGIVGYAEGGAPEMFAGDAMRGVGAKDRDSADTSEQSPFEALIEKLGIKKALKAVAERHAEMTGMGAPATAEAIPTAAPKVSSAATPAAPAPERTWTGKAMDPAQLSRWRALTDPEEQAGVAAYDRWAAANPEQASAPRAAQDQGAPGGITAALPQPPAQYDAPPPAAPRVQTPDYSALMAANARQLKTDPAKDRDTEAARYRKEVGAPDTSATDAMLADYAERKKRLAPRDGIMDLLREYAKAPGQQWWQTGAAGGQSLIDLNEKRAEQRDALSDKGFAAMQAKANAGRDFNKDAYGAGIKGQEVGNAQLDKGVTAGTSMRNADAAAGASMYHADQQLRAAKMQAERATAAGDKASLHEAVAMMRASAATKQADLLAMLKDFETKGSKEGALMIDKKRAEIAAIERDAAYYSSKILVDKFGEPPQQAAAAGAVKRLSQPVGPVIN